MGTRNIGVGERLRTWRERGRLWISELAIFNHVQCKRPKNVELGRLMNLELDLLELQA
jgi:hypothetical protein